MSAPATLRPVIEVQERRRSSASGPHRLRGQRRGRGACRSAAILASLIECGEDW